MRKIIFGLMVFIALILSVLYFFPFSPQQQAPPEPQSIIASSESSESLSSGENISQSQENEGIGRPDELPQKRQQDITKRAEHLYRREQKLGVVVKPEHPITFDLKAHIPPELQKNQ